MTSKETGHLELPRDGSAPTNSLVIPVYRNEENIPSLLQALQELDEQLGGNLEVIFVVDGSPDRSGELLLAAQKNSPFKSVVALHSRNFGSFIAIRTGLALAEGKAIAVMAADLQEPPELVLQFFQALADDSADIVLGERTERSDSLINDLLSNLYWTLYRGMINKEVPKGGVDVFACTAHVRDELLAFEESNTSLVAQLFWVGFRRKLIPYKRRPREIGTSAWNFSRRFRYMMDSIFSFTDFPIMLILWIGIFGTAISFVFGGIVFVARLMGTIAIPGYATIVLLIIFLNSLSLTVQGIMGVYLWRTFENTKRRPLGIVRKVWRSDRSSQVQNAHVEARGQEH